MRLKYVFTTAGIKAGSVQTKVINQIKAFNFNGAQCKGVFFTTDDAEHLSNELYEFVKVPRVGKTWFRSFKQKKAYQNTVREYFIKNSEDFDFIYCRYPGAGSDILEWTKQFKKIIIFEHVTAEMPETRLYAKSNPFKWTLSDVLGRVEFMYLPMLQEWLYGGRIRRNAFFGICNSGSIAEYEDRVSGKTYIELISGDAVNTADYELRVPKLNDGEFNMLFLKGAVTEADFNGLDRILRGMANYKGELKLKFYLFGTNLETEKKLAKKLGIETMVQFGDFIDKKGIDELVNQMHIGLSAMGVHRKGIDSTTTIKSREYFARGLPFVYGHKDPDLSGKPELKEFCLELEANDEAVNFEDVMDWYENASSKNYQSMREYAVNELDYKVKMKKVINQIKNK